MTENEVVSYIRDNFVYLEDGSFLRNDRRNSSGCYDKDGYLIMKIKGKQYKAHRLVFAYFHGRFPIGEIDHINRNRADNRIENLREVSRLENERNKIRKVNKDTGVVGVYLDRCTKGLKKRYTFRVGNKTYRAYTVEEALRERERIKGA